jgi:hypothetical protein
MLKKIGPLFFLFMLIAACAGKPAVSDGALIDPSFLFSAPRDGELVFLGVAGKRSSSKETLKYALEDAARRVVLFNQVAGEYAVESSIGSGAFDYYNNTQTALYYNEGDVAKYVDSLKYDAGKKSDTIEIEKTVFIRTTYPSTLPFPVNYRPTYSVKDKKPSWVDNPNVEIPGYDVGIGYSWRYSSQFKTWINSYNNAVFSIIRNINSSSSSRFGFYQTTGSVFGSNTYTSDSITFSYGTLYGFYVLDAWMDPETKAVWTLAIARKAQ